MSTRQSALRVAFFFLQEQGQSRRRPTVPPRPLLLHSFCLQNPSHLATGPLPLFCTNPTPRRGIWGAIWWTRHAAGAPWAGWADSRAPGGAVEGRRRERRAELSFPISWRIVPDTRRPCGVSVSGSFAGAVTHARGSGSERGAAKSDQRGRPHHHHLAGSLLCSLARSLEERGRAPGDEGGHQFLPVSPPHTPWGRSRGRNISHTEGRSQNQHPGLP